MILSYSPNKLMPGCATMNTDEWEAICRKCGKCCYEKVDLGGGIIRYTDEPCAHLDTESKLCKVYHNRGDVEPDCITLTEHLVRTLTWLPEDCAYSEYVRMQDTLSAIRCAKKQTGKTSDAKRRKR